MPPACPAHLPSLFGLCLLCSLVASTTLSALHHQACSALHLQACSALHLPACSATDKHPASQPSACKSACLHCAFSTPSSRIVLLVPIKCLLVGAQPTAGVCVWLLGPITHHSLTLVLPMSQLFLGGVAGVTFCCFLYLQNAIRFVNGNVLSVLLSVRYLKKYSF